MEDISAGASMMKSYPDISPLLEKKMQRRLRLARLSFEEKIEMVNKWREITRQIRRLRRTDRRQTGKQIRSLP